MGESVSPRLVRGFSLGVAEGATLRVGGGLQSGCGHRSKSGYRFGLVMGERVAPGLVGSFNLRVGEGVLLREG